MFFCPISSCGFREWEGPLSLFLAALLTVNETEESSNGVYFCNVTVIQVVVVHLHLLQSVLRWDETLKVFEKSGLISRQWQ